MNILAIIPARGGSKRLNKKNVYPIWGKPMIHWAIKSCEDSEFNIIHGDPTFSNIIISKSNKPYLIDPRLKFGKSDYYGDPFYDWAKLFYSVVGSYDNFILYLK